MTAVVGHAACQFLARQTLEFLGRPADAFGGQVSEVLQRRGESQAIQAGTIGVAQFGREIQAQLLRGLLAMSTQRSREG